MSDPIQEWLARVEAECGSPEAILMHATHVSHENTRLLLTRHALRWNERKLGTICDGCGTTKADCDAFRPPVIKCCPDCRHERREKEKKC